MTPLHAGRGPTRPLRAVPDPVPEHPVIRALDWLHRANGAVSIQREAKHFAQHAEQAGEQKLARAFWDAYEAAGRAREMAR
jgi:hypothetical protein